MAPHRWALCSVALLFALAGSLALADRLDAVELLGVPPMRPPFADLRVLTGAAEGLRAGLDPMRENPADPWGRLLNYPRVWLVLAPLGVAPRHIVALALALWAAAALGLAWLARRADRPLAAWALACSVLSPAWAFALERANTDLLVFALLVAAAAAFERRPALGASVVGLASALKLFPIAALAVALERRPLARRAGAGVLVAFALYFVAIRGDLERIAANTQHWPPLSHGVALAPAWASRSLGVAPWAAWSLTLAALIAAGVFALRLRALEHPHAPLSAPQSSALRIGAGVHVGAFLLGSNFDYRLIFLALATPGLAVWAEAPSARLRWLARAALTAIVACVWSLAWRGPLGALCGSFAANALEEGASWLCWALMACVLAVATPLSAGGSEGDSSPSAPAASVRRPVRSLLQGSRA